ncbi:MAG: CHASE2 domain-containing protein [Bacteroidota bacterium]
MNTDKTKGNRPLKKNKIKWLFRDAFFCTVLSLVAFSLLANLILSTSYFNPLLHSIRDFSFLDAYYNANFSDQGKIDSTLLLVNIGDLDRKGIADLLDTLQQQNPEVLGLDIIFKEVGNKLDTVLFNEMSKDNVVMSYIYNPDSLGTMGENLPLTSTFGYVNLTSVEPTEVIRGFKGVQSSGQDKYYSLVSQMMRSYQNGHIWNTQGYSQKLLRERRVKFYGHFKDFPHVEGADVLLGKGQNNLTDKIVLVGYAGYPSENPYDVEDKHFTPLNAHPLGKGIPDMFGITVHANITNMLLQNDFFWELGVFGQGLLIFLFSYLTCLYFIWLDRKLKISYRTVRKLVLFVFAVVLVGVCFWLFGKNVVVEPTLIVMTTIFSAGFVKYYKHLVRYIKTKHKFKSYLK